MPARPRPAELPITEDDAFIAAALKSASIPTLMMSIVHMTGDTSLLRGRIRPQRALLGEAQGFLSEEDKAAVRAQALDAVRAYRDRGCTLPPPPSAETIHAMMSFVVGEPVPDEYVPMMLEELALDDDFTRDIHWDDTVPAVHRQRFRVVIIGAGMSGLLAAIRLREAGIPFVVIEKNERVGGTWHENTYPGCRVDIANHFYCYSFEPNHDWSEFYSRQQELAAYFERCADKYGIREHIRFRTEVVAAVFDAATSQWRVRLRAADGNEDSVIADALISAVGQLNRPKIPDFPGLASFRGPAFHSARWQHEHDLTGKRVAVVGTGASAFQLVPELAAQAAQVVVFQRSPAWMVPNPNYHRRVSDGTKWLLKHLPYYGRWYRFLIFWPGSDGLLPSLIVDPSWPHPERSVNAANEQMRIAFTEYMKSQVGDDPELLEKVVPKYPPFGKRMLQDNGSWLSTLRRDNVTLVTDAIERISADAVICADGTRYAVDAIVFATGFHANKFLWPMEIRGRDGVLLNEVWGDDPAAYLGITVPGFPNLFCLYGPATNLAHAGSIIFHSECQVRYVMSCLQALLEGDFASMECKASVCAAFNERLQAALARTVWAHPDVDSWYKNARGRVTTTSPWRLVDYWRWTKEPNLDDYVLTRRVPSAGAA
jgi:4-hydroxyacetophenone monooxygenase